MLPIGTIPEAAEFLAPLHAAAVNAMSSAAVIGICARLGRNGGGNVARRAVLSELDRVGSEVLRLWPDLGRRGPRKPRGIWPPPPEDDDGPAAPPAPAPPPPAGFRS